MITYMEAKGAGTTAVWGSITGTLSSQADLQAQITNPTQDTTWATGSQPIVRDSTGIRHEIGSDTSNNLTLTQLAST